MKDGDSRQDTEIAVFSFLQRGLSALDLSVVPDQIHQLTDLVLLLESWAGKINLTGHREPLAMAGRLVLDAAALAAAVPELASATSVADLGTGAGFPGLPLAILYPGLDVYLVDSRLKRNHFQREARRRLGLERVKPILGRSDEVEQVPCDVVVAQAMTQPDRALALMAEWVRSEAMLLLPASEASERPDPPVGISVVALREYTVPETGVRRRLWVCRVDS